MSSALLEAAYRSSKRRTENPDEPMKTSMVLSEFMAAFVVGHELGHILRGHCDHPEPAETEERWREELEADDAGAFLLTHHIYRQIGGGSLAEITESDGPAVQIATNEALIAVGLLFEVFFLFGEFARRMGMNWTRSHPPGDLRYQRFRTYNVQRLYVPEWAFSRGSGVGAPDSVQGLIRKLAADSLA